MTSPAGIAMIPSKHPYQPHIDGLRAVAVIAVLWFHAFPQSLRSGFIGVDIFFVISGFLISGILYADFSAPARTGFRVIGGFYGRRVRRIFPALILILLACHLLGWRLLMPTEFEKMARHLVAGAGFCLNFVLAGQTGYFHQDASASPLLHLWSLGIEEQFYLIWPLVIWVGIRCRIKILPTVVFLAACSYWWNARMNDGTAAFYLPQMRMWELLIGGIAAAGLRWSGPSAAPADTAASWGELGRIRPNAWAAAGLVMIATGFLIIHNEMDLPNAWVLLPTAGTALMICAGGSAWINRRILAWRPLVWVGLISYPLYLWHWPLLTFARLASDQPNSPWLKGAMLGASVVLAWLTYRFVEIPVRQARSLGWGAAGLAAGMVLVAGLGWHTWRAGGFPDRFPPLLNEIAAFKHDPAKATRQGTHFLIGDQDETPFRQDPDRLDPRKPTIYLWGDSHAACLYPGLNTVHGERYNIVQRTTARTPPFLPAHFNPGNARQINQFVLDSIRAAPPDCVLLHASWTETTWPDVEETLVFLKAAGIRHIILIGPVPVWIGSLPQQLYNYARRHPGETVPVRMNRGLDPQTFEVDRRMADLAARLQVDYVSPCRILGNQDGFLVRTGDTADALTTHDNTHLTVSGSNYLMARFPGF